MRSQQAKEFRRVGRPTPFRIHILRAMPCDVIVSIVRVLPSSSPHQPTAIPFSDIHRPCMLQRAVAYRVPGLAVFIEMVTSWCV